MYDSSRFQGVTAREVDQALPASFSSIKRIDSLTLGPSPIHALPAISKDLGGKVQIWAKREDLNSGLAFGGNKTRKLEYVLWDAQHQGCDTLVSIGGVQSNHTRQIAACATALSMKAKLINKHWVNWEDNGYEKTGNIQLSKLMCAESILTPEGFSIKDTTEDSPVVAKILDEIRGSGGKPYWIPAGASDHPLGGLGFARWAFEVARQEQVSGIFFDTVIVCAVTGSTFGGMLAGFKLLEKTGGRSRKVIGVDASAKPDDTFQQVLKIAKFTATAIGLSENDISAEEIILDQRFAGPAYGIPDRETAEAIQYGASKEAFITDPVYEGKTLAAMIHMIKTGEISGGNVLFAHLGGQLALNAYTDMPSLLK